MRAPMTMLLAAALSVTAVPVSEARAELVSIPETVADDVLVPFPAAGDVRAAGSDPAVRSEPIATPVPFSMVGFELPADVDEVRVRTSVDGREWGPWTTTARLDQEDGPDPGTDEAQHDRSERFTEPVWVEEGRHLQVELPGAAATPSGELRAALIDSRGLSDGVGAQQVPEVETAAATAGRPRIISRQAWGANESWARSTRAASRVHTGVVHHTATSNSYSDARAVMRSMYRYHTQELGWADLGYNVVVDQQGNIYEGRAGGLERGIIGAHAAGYNTGSFGVALIGNFDLARPPQVAVDAVAEVVAWQSRVHGIDPEGWTNATGAWRRTIVGHRDVGTTACPGTYFYPRLGEVRQTAAAGIDATPKPPAPLVPPRTTITSGPSGSMSQTTATLTFSATGDVSFYECQWQGDAWYPCASPRVFTGLTEGEYTFRARAVDPEGNREASPPSRTWTVDTTPSFSDVNGGVHAAGIIRVASAGIAQGYADGTFRPREGVRRDHMATFLTRALQLPAGDPSRFSDVGGGPHAASVGAVAEAGISEGYPDGTFRPATQVTRAQMATFLAAALDLPEGDLIAFSDVDGGAHARGIAAVAAAGITEGFSDGTFRPSQVVTREQMATFLSRALDLVEAP